MLCAKCRRESGDLYCGKCREEIRVAAQVGRPQDVEVLIPLLAYDPIDGVYRFGCTVVGCPYNGGDGWCTRVVPTEGFGLIKFHPFDGDNCVVQFCG